MKVLLKDFAANVAAGNIEIYNEFSLQHELGIFLRGMFPDMQVQFERNVGSFFSSQFRFLKKEIDISIVCRNTEQKHSVFELKFPRNGQHPEQMFSFCKDIVFLEQLKFAGFEKGYFVVFADDRLFFEGSGTGIYEYFRAGRQLTGTVQKPTGTRDCYVAIRGTYRIEWFPVGDRLKYAVVEVQ